MLANGLRQILRFWPVSKQCALEDIARFLFHRTPVAAARSLSHAFTRSSSFRMVIPATQRSRRS
jgi:hypothetical protein